ncbi:MAG: hypothetical protein JO022_05770 [Acidobacteriaceae bacterium]|nr:hypothetical protein [Acidobacteriaceae bacterium]
MENANIAHEMEKQECDLPPVNRATLAFRHLADGSRSLDLLARYATRHNQQFSRAFENLMKWRERSAAFTIKGDSNISNFHLDPIPHSDTSPQNHEPSEPATNSPAPEATATPEPAPDRCIQVPPTPHAHQTTFEPQSPTQNQIKTNLSPSKHDPPEPQKP